MLILNSFRQQAIVVRQQVVAVPRQQVVPVVHQQVVAVPRQQVVPVVHQQVVAVQRAFADKTLPTELCLPLQVAIASSSYLPPKNFYYSLII